MDRSVKIRYDAIVDGYLAKVARAKAATTDFAKSTGESARKNKADWELLGGGMLKAGGALAAGLGLAGKAAIDWESAWAGVTKTIDGTPAQMAEMETGLRNMAKTLPATHEEIAAVAEAAGQLGVKREDVLGFTRTMIDLGVSTNLSADEAATAIAQISNVMGTMSREGAAGVQKFGSALVELGNNGASTERDIVEMASRIAGAAKVVGMTEADLLAVSNALASVGVEAEAGGTAISKVLMDMSKAVDTGSKHLANFAQVAGMSTENFSALFKKAPAEAMSAFTQGLARIKQEGGDVFTVLDKLGLKDVRVTSAMLKMAGAGDLLTKSLQDGRRAWEENSALTDEATKRYETNASKIRVSANRIKDASIDIGGSIAPLMAGAAEAVGDLAATVSDLPAPVQQAGVAVAGVATAALLAGGTFLTMVPKIAAAKTAMVELGITSTAVRGVLGGPWGMAIAAGTVALGLFAKSQWDAHQKAQELRDTLDSQTGAITDNTRALVAKGLQESGAFERARKYGVAIEDLTSAALGEGDALQRLQARHAELERAQEASFKATVKAGDGLEAFTGKTTSGVAGLDAWADSSDKAEAKTRSQAAGLEALIKTVAPTAEILGKQTAATKEVAQATGAAAAAADEMTAANTDAAAAAELTAKQYKEVQDAILMLGGGVRAEAAAIRSSKTALEEATKAGKDNSKTLDDRRAALETLAESYLQVTTKQMDMGRGTDEINATLQQNREQFIKTATAALGSRDAAIELADAMGLIPEQVIAQVEVAGTLESTAQVADLRESIFRLDGKVVTVKEEGAKPSKGRVLELDARIFGLKGKTVKVEELGSTASGERVVRLKGKIYTLTGKTVAVGVTGADAGAQQVQALQNNINRLRGNTVTVGVRYVTEGRLPSGGLSTAGGTTRAAGGIVYGPGTSTSDSIPAWLSNGEYVIKAAAVARYGRHLFDDYNAMRLAEGGPAYDRMRPAPPELYARTVAAPTASTGPSPAQLSSAVAGAVAAALDARLGRLGPRDVLALVRAGERQAR